MIVKQSNAELPWPLLKKIAVMQNNKDTEQALCNTPGHTKAYVSVCVSGTKVRVTSPNMAQHSQSARVTHIVSQECKSNGYL